MSGALHRISRLPLSVSRSWEQCYPWVFGATATSATLLWGDQVTSVCKAHDWHLDQVYPAIFGFLAITTGYLATFYGTIQSISDGFIGKIKHTRVMGRFLHFSKSAIVWGFIVSVITVPLMVISPLPTDGRPTKNLVVAVWIGISVASIASFYRVASMLFFLFEAKIPENGREI